jgi:hypothetical protein
LEIGIFLYSARMKVIQQLVREGHLPSRGRDHSIPDRAWPFAAQAAARARSVAENFSAAMLAAWDLNARSDKAFPKNLTARHSMCSN